MLEEAITQFIRHITVQRGLSLNTVSSYSAVLTSMLEFLKANSSSLPGGLSDWSDVGAEHIRLYLNDLREREYALRTRAHKIATLKSFFKFLLRQGYITENPMEKVVSARVARPLPKAVSKELLVELLRALAADRTPAGRRDWAIFELMYASGLRVSEVIGLKISDLDFFTRTVRVTGKGSKTRVIPVHNLALDSLQTYLKSRPKMAKQIVDAQAFFINSRGQALTRQGINFVLNKRLTEAGITQKMSPHTLRHSFAVHLLSGGASLLHIQQLLGHSSVATTQIYTTVDMELRREQYDRAQPQI